MFLGAGVQSGALLSFRRQKGERGNIQQARQPCPNVPGICENAELPEVETVLSSSDRSELKNRYARAGPFNASAGLGSIGGRRS